MHTQRIAFTQRHKRDDHEQIICAEIQERHGLFGYLLRHAEGGHVSRETNTIQDYKAIHMILFKTISLHGLGLMIRENIGKHQKTFTKHYQYYLGDEFLFCFYFLSLITGIF